MSLDTEVRALLEVPMFREIEPSRLKLLAFASERLVFKPEQVLFNRGDFSDCAYVILEGSANVVLDGPEGSFTVATLERHAIVGEMGILTNSPRSATVVAATELSVLKIGKDVFFELANEFPGFAVGMMRDLAGRLDRTNALLASLQAK